jgi:hypothetical protein
VLPTLAGTFSTATSSNTSNVRLGPAVFLRAPGRHGH